MKLELVNGKGVALVDKQDYKRLSHFRWYLAARRYAVRYDRGKLRYMHHEILPRQADLEIDHVNGNGLDNRRKNLRLVSHSVNLHNQSRKPTGVSLDKRRNKWKARITIQKREVWLGYFENYDDAVIAVTKARGRYCV